MKRLEFQILDTFLRKLLYFSPDSMKLCDRASENWSVVPWTVAKSVWLVALNFYFCSSLVILKQSIENVAQHFSNACRTTAVHFSQTAVPFWEMLWASTKHRVVVTSSHTKSAARSWLKRMCFGKIEALTLLALTLISIRCSQELKTLPTFFLTHHLSTGERSCVHEKIYRSLVVGSVYRAYIVQIE